MFQILIYHRLIRKHLENILYCSGKISFGTDLEENAVGRKKRNGLAAEKTSPNVEGSLRLRVPVRAGCGVPKAEFLRWVSARSKERHKN